MSDEGTRITPAETGQHAEPPHVNPVVRFAVEHRVTMAMAVLGVVVLGALSLARLPLEFLPTFSSTHISVSAPYPSSSPEETERRIVRPLEDALSGINGLSALTAQASADSGQVSVEFEDGVDMDLAVVEVRDRVDRVRATLPDDLERVRIRRFQSTDMPVIRFQLSSPWPSDRLYRFVEEVVQRRLERLEGVAEVSVSGVLDRQLKVEVVPSRLAAHGVDIRQVAAVLRQNNVTTSAGTIREGSRVFHVRVIGELSSLEQVRALPLRTGGLRLADVADVSLEFPDRDSFDFLNGKEAVGVNIYKASTANLLAVADRTRAELEAIRALPEAKGLQVKVFFDSSKDVREGIESLRNSGILGGVLAVLCIWLFLRRVRTTLLAGISIPLSVVLSFVIIYLGRQAGWLDITLNVISLMGLMLAIGMLVDSSIVVIESIYRHRQDEGADARTAALVGASEVALPIAASTLTTICVFLPLIFLGTGRFANFMKNMGATIVIVIVASLLVAVTVVPMVAARLLTRESARRATLLDRVSLVYGRGLHWTLRHRFAFALAVAALLGLSLNLYGKLGRSNDPPSFERQLRVQVDTPKSYSLEQKHATYREVFDLLDANRAELEIADIAYSYRRGSGRSRGWGHSNRIEIYLVDEARAKLDTGTIRDRLQALLPVRPGVTFTLARSMRGHSGSGAGIDITLEGDRLDVLEVLAHRVTLALNAIPELKDVDSSLESGDEEIRVVPATERVVQAGLSSQAIGSTVSGALSSRPVGYLRSGERELDIVAQYREEDRQTIEQMAALPVAFGRSPLPVGAVATFQRAAGARSIEREDRRAVIRISADLASGVPPFLVMDQVGAVMSGLNLPAGYSWSYGRDWRAGQDESSSALFTLLFALVLVYMIMAVLFESFAHPFTIMFSVPFAFVGVGLVMWALGLPRDRTSDMGLIILAGIVVNNAIVLVDHINRLRRKGLERAEAIVLASRHRLRPILMTAITTMLGLAPLVAPYFLPQIFGSVEGRAAFWAPVGLVILAGLTTSTFFTLTVIPTIYSLVDDLTLFVGRLVRGAPAQAEVASDAPGAV